MPAITSLDLSNAKLDVDHIAAIATSLQPTTTDRLGNTKDTMSGAVYSIKSFNNRDIWQPDTNYGLKDLVNVTVSAVTTWYVCVVSHTSSSVFAPDSNSKWRVYQGITTGDLAASGGSGTVGFLSSGTGAVTTSVESELRRFPKSPEQFGCIGDGVTDDSINIGKWLTAAAGSWCRPTPGKLYRITTSMASLTSFEINISGDNNCFSSSSHTISTGQPWAAFIFDGVNATISGFWDTATNTVTYPTKIKGLKNVVIAGKNGSKYGIVEHLTNAIISGVHFQDFTDYGVMSLGPVFFKMHDVSMYNCGLGKAASGTFSSGTFISGCGWHSVGLAPSGALGNYITCRDWTLNNFGSTTSISNVYVDTVYTQTTSCKGAIICNLRSASLTNFGTYSGIYVEYSEVQQNSSHLETYATGGDTVGDGNPQSQVYLNSVITGSNSFSIYDPLVIVTTPVTSGTDYWGYDLDVRNRRQIGVLGVDELILGQKLKSGSTQRTHVASSGTSDNPIIYWNKVLNALCGSKGNSFVPILSMPTVLVDNLLASSFVDLNSSILCPAVDTGSGPGGVYDIDIQLYNASNGAIYQSASWVGVRQIASGKYNIRFYANGGIINNEPSGGFTITESDTGVYNLRLTNNTVGNYKYAVTSRLKIGALPTAM